MRKIIQITTNPGSDRSYQSLFALTDDGRLYVLNLERMDEDWQRINIDTIVGDES